MIKKGKKLRVRKVYSEGFRKSIVREYESGQFTVRELTKLYGLCYQTIYVWIYRYSAYNKKGLKVVEMTSSSTKKITELKTKIADLERTLGQKQIQIEYLEALVEVAKEDLGVDLKKKGATLQSKR